MAIDLLVVVALYVALLVYAVIATVKLKRKCDITYEEFHIGGRSIGLSITTISLAACVCGNAITGTMDKVGGLVWTQFVIGSSIGLLIGGLVFARHMRRGRYMTVMEPFQQKYGNAVSVVLTFLMLAYDMTYSSVLLQNLGRNIVAVLDLDSTMVMLLTTGTVFIYTCFGGFFAVAYTSVIQLFSLLILWFAVGFGMSHEAVKETNVTRSDFVGQFPQNDHIGFWVDMVFLIVLGGIPTQIFFQRILSCKSAGYSQVSSVLASLTSLFIAIPVACIGYIAVNTDWAQVTTQGQQEDANMYLNTYDVIRVLQYLCPIPVRVLSTCALAAAVMAVVDACYLSSATLITHHLYRPLRSVIFKSRPASELEYVWLSRVAVFLVAVISTVASLTVETSIGRYFVAQDLVYIVMFPQLICVLFIPICNIWGSLSGVFVGVTLRLLSGEKLLYLPMVIKYPMYDSKNEVQYFPHRTLVMLIVLLVIVVASVVAAKVIAYRIMPHGPEGSKTNEWFGHDGQYKPKQDENQEISLSDIRSEESSEVTDTKL